MALQNCYIFCLLLVYVLSKIVHETEKIGDYRAYIPTTQIKQ
jgi:hypothetical protein